MADVGSMKSLLKMVPRILKAIIKGFVWFLLLYTVPVSLLSMAGVPVDLFPDYVRLLGVYAAISVFFIVVAELFSKTVFQYGLNIAKGIVMMAFYIYAMNGGFVTASFETIRILIDIRAYVAMLMSINFLGLAKSVLQALNFLSERTEASYPLKRE